MSESVLLRRRKFAALTGAAVVAAPAVVRAQGKWKPDRPITIYNPFAAGGVTTYEWAGSEPAHHHLLCEGCGGTKEVEVEAIAALAAEVQRDHGFTVDLRHLAIRGHCARCRLRSRRGPCGRATFGATRLPLIISPDLLSQLRSRPKCAP